MSKFWCVLFGHRRSGLETRTTLKKLNDPHFVAEQYVEVRYSCSCGTPTSEWITYDITPIDTLVISPDDYKTFLEMGEVTTHA